MKYITQRTAGESCFPNVRKWYYVIEPPPSVIQGGSKFRPYVDSGLNSAYSGTIQQFYFEATAFKTLNITRQLKPEHGKVQVVGVREWILED
jgi:hypothetical protein